MSRTRETLFVGICAVSHLLTQAALGQVLAPIDYIAPEFGDISPGEQSWFIAGYSLTVGTFIMISGRIGDIFGHKRVFAFGYAWLGVWSCFAGFSGYTGSQIFFDVCRAMQGIGPALLMPNALALFGRAYPPGVKKNIVFSIFGSLAPAGFVIGATFGSLFAQLAWWPWAFWTYGIAALMLGSLSILIIPAAFSTTPEPRPHFDWAGSIVIVAGLVLVNVAFNNAPLYGWTTPHVYFVLIIGLMCLGAFIWIERRAVNPLLPLRAMNRTVGYVLALVGVGWGSFGVWVFYNIRFLQHFRGATPLSVSAQYSPAVVAGLLAAGLTGFMLTHTPVSFVMMISMVAFFVGIIVACFQPMQQVYWAQTFVSILIMPFGMDMSFPAATVILSNHMPPDHQGLAASLVNTVVNYSISIALGIAGTVDVYAPFDSPFQQNRNAFYLAMGLSGMGVLLGAMFFIHSWIKEGWVVMAH
jgi:MFS family permease